MNLVMQRKFYWPAIVIVAVAVAFGVYSALVPKAEAPEQLTVVPKSSDSDLAQKAEEVKSPEEQAKPATVPKAKPASSPLTYDEALKKYANSRIQLDKDCNAFPGQMSIANGTEIMLDNRSPEERSVVFDLKTYKISGYGFTVVKTSAKTLPLITYLDCGLKQNVSKITVQ